MTLQLNITCDTYQQHCDSGKHFGNDSDRILGEELGLLTPRQDYQDKEVDKWLEKQEEFQLDGENFFQKFNQKTDIIKIVKIDYLGKWALGSNLGIVNIWIPLNNLNIKQNEIKLHELRYVDMIWNLNGRNQWCVTKLYPKLHTKQLRLLTIQSLWKSDSRPKFKFAPGPIFYEYKYQYIVPLSEKDIATAIGSNGININSIIKKWDTERRHAGGWASTDPNSYYRYNPQEDTKIDITQHSTLPNKAIISIFVRESDIYHRDYLLKNDEIVDNLVSYFSS